VDRTHTLQAYPTLTTHIQIFVFFLNRPELELYTNNLITMCVSRTVASHAVCRRSHGICREAVMKCHMIAESISR